MELESPAQQEQQIETSPDITTQQVATQQAPQTIDQNQLAEQIASATVQAQKIAAVEKTNQEMTPEQQAEHFKTFNVNEDFTQNFVSALQPNEEGKVDLANVAKVLEQMRDGFVGQSLRAAELMQAQELGQFQQQLAPVQQFAAEQQQEKAWAGFAEKHPHLKDYRKVVDMVSSQLVASGYKPTNNDELFATVAQQVEAHIKAINPNTVFPKTQPNVTTPMSTVAMPGSQSVKTEDTGNQNPNFDADIFG